MIKHIDVAALKLIRAELEKVLPDINKKLGCNLQVGKGTYGHTSGSFKIDITPLAPDGSTVTKDGQNFKQYASSFGLDPSDLNAKFVSGGIQYEITGLKPSAYKRPIIAKSMKNGKSFVFPADAVLRGLGRKTVATAKPISINLPMPGMDLSGPEDGED